MAEGRTRYYYIPPERDTREIKKRYCSLCRQEWEVRVPSVGEGWTICPTCHANLDMQEIKGKGEST